MNPNDPMENVVKKLGYRLSPEARDRVLEKACGALDKMGATTPAPSRPRIWRTTMHTQTGKFALAAAAILIVLGGITFWPFGSIEDGQWWSAPPAAWGQGISASLDRIQALIYHEAYVFVGDYGSTHVSGNWSRWYKTKGGHRRDKFYDEDLVSTMWEVPEPNGSVLRYDVSFEYECYTIQTYESGSSGSDPVDMLRFYVDLLDEADRVLETKTFEGKECTGFEIRAAKYGNNPDSWIDRIWFDTKTKLPVRIERHHVVCFALPGGANAVWRVTLGVTVGCTCMPCRLLFCWPSRYNMRTWLDSSTLSERPHPACLDGELGWTATHGSFRTPVTSFPHRPPSAADGERKMLWWNVS